MPYRTHEVRTSSADGRVGVGYTDVNAETIDRWVDNGWERGIPISHEAFVRACASDWQVALTPIKSVPEAWFPRLDRCRVLGLASGGGQQMPVFASLGADCKVLDYSQKQLDSEKILAEREGYLIRTVRADMTQPLPFDDRSFDLIFHPVSNCYVDDVLPIWRECCRALKQGGILMSGLDNGMNFIVDERETEVVHSLPYDPLEDVSLRAELEKTDSGIHFSHTLEEQIWGQLQPGSAI